MLFTYLHLAGVSPQLTGALLESQTTGIAYETVERENGQYPLLAQMSAVAGALQRLQLDPFALLGLLKSWGRGLVDLHPPAKPGGGHAERFTGRLDPATGWAGRNL